MELLNKLKRTRLELSRVEFIKKRMHRLLICVIRIKQFRVLTNHSIKQKANANNSTYVFPNANTQKRI